MSRLASLLWAGLVVAVVSVVLAPVASAGPARYAPPVDAPVIDGVPSAGHPVRTGQPGPRVRDGRPASPVRAAADGEVTFAGPGGGRAARHRPARRRPAHDRVVPRHHRRRGGAARARRRPPRHDVGPGSSSAPGGATRTSIPRRCSPPGRRSVRLVPFDVPPGSRRGRRAQRHPPAPRRARLGRWSHPRCRAGGGRCGRAGPPVASPRTASPGCRPAAPVPAARRPRRAGGPGAAESSPVVLRSVAAQALVTAWERGPSSRAPRPMRSYHPRPGAGSPCWSPGWAPPASTAPSTTWTWRRSATPGPTWCASATTAVTRPEPAPRCPSAADHPVRARGHRAETCGCRGVAWPTSSRRWPSDQPGRADRPHRPLPGRAWSPRLAAARARGPPRPGLARPPGSGRHPRHAPRRGRPGHRRRRAAVGVPGPGPLFLDGVLGTFAPGLGADSASVSQLERHAPSSSASSGTTRWRRALHAVSIAARGDLVVPVPRARLRRGARGGRARRRASTPTTSSPGSPATTRELALALAGRATGVRALAGCPARPARGHGRSAARARPLSPWPASSLGRPRRPPLASPVGQATA